MIKHDPITKALRLVGTHPIDTDALQRELYAIRSALAYLHRKVDAQDQSLQEIARIKEDQSREIHHLHESLHTMEEGYRLQVQVLQQQVEQAWARVREMEG